MIIRRAFAGAVGLAVALSVAVMASAPVTAQAGDVGYDVWLTDQNNTVGFSSTTPRGTHGGRLLIYRGEDLTSPSGPVNAPTVVDLATVFAAGGPHNSTGANVVRPHMVDQSPDGKYVALAFVASGHVALVDAATRQPKALFRMSAGAAGARQAHAAFWTQDGAAVIVANQNGKLLERIDYNASIDTFVHNTAATLDLANCTTPSGNACQTNTPVSESDPAFLGPDNRPDNAPICPITTAAGHAMVTLRGGGMFVVDTAATPMAIVAAYGNATMGRDGCGGRQLHQDIYLNAGTGTLVTNPQEFSLYHLRDDFPHAPAVLADNDVAHAPKVFHRGDGERDAHGMAVLRGGRGAIWQFDRLANEVLIFQRGSLKHIGTSTLAGAVSSDPTPDIVDVSPDERFIFAALRGPNPQTGAHASAGSTPGLGIVTIDKVRVRAELSAVLPTSFQNTLNGTEESDPHGLAVSNARPSDASTQSKEWGRVAN